MTELTEDMVITHHMPVGDHRLVTHRVVPVDRTADGRVTVQTQGDANAAIDPWTARTVGTRVGRAYPAHRPRISIITLTSYGWTAETPRSAVLSC